MIRFNYITKNGNYLIADSGLQRFINANGEHLRWVDDEESEYLIQVLECVDSAPVPVNCPPVPSIVTYWEHIESPEFPELSNNGGSYAYLTRVEKWEGWDSIPTQYRLLENRLYGSDFSGQGYVYSRTWDSEMEAQKFIEQFITIKPSIR